MAPDEMLELAQHLLRGPDLVGPMVAGVLSEDQCSGLGLVGVVRQPVDTYRDNRRPRPPSDRRRTQRNRREPAAAWHRLAGADDVPLARPDHQLLAPQRLHPPPTAPS